MVTRTKFRELDRDTESLWFVGQTQSKIPESRVKMLIICVKPQEHLKGVGAVLVDVGLKSPGTKTRHSR